MVLNQSKKSNMWKLDLLEAKFENFTPRFPHTKKLLGARNTEKLYKRLPSSKEDALKEIKALKEEFFNKKYYGSYKKIEKEIQKYVKLKTNEKEIEFFKNPENTKTLIVSKLIKCIQSTILLNKELKQNPPAYIPSNIREIITDKSNPSNPSAFFITFCQNNKDINRTISNLWNSKKLKPLIEEVEWSFRMVRGNLSVDERKARQTSTNNKDIDHDSDSEELDSDGDSGLDSSDEGSEKEGESDSEPMDAERAFDEFAKFDNLVVDSDGEDETQLDPNINYDEVTDEEMSEESEDESEDDFFDEAPKPKEKKKHNLPELAVGYISEGSDSEDFDIDNDKVVKEATSQRKNRRGQRARQKIWAKKYGREATHVKKEQAQIASERERRQLEYEERCRKREEKAKLAQENAPSGSNIAPLGERKKRNLDDKVQSKEENKEEPVKMHPSWEAKKLAEEKLKNVKFTGKKITFD